MRNFKDNYTIFNHCWVVVTGVSVLTYSFFAPSPSALGGLLPPLPALPPAGLSPVGALSRSLLIFLTFPLSSKNSYCLF